MPTHCSDGKKIFVPAAELRTLFITHFALSINNLQSMAVLLEWEPEEEYKEC